MKRTLLCVLLLCGPALWAADAPNAQIQRGKQFFLNSPKGLPCATCHSLEGNGTAIGPDLTRLASVVGPRGLVMTIQMTMTAYVQQVSLKNGRVFPGIQKEKQGDNLDIYDLSKTPAVLLQLKSSEVSAMTQNTKWSHPPTSAGYTPDELADIISYLKFAATGVAAEVKASELR
jgi:putative heme-binding domain-containing protein